MTSSFLAAKPNGRQRYDIPLYIAQLKTELFFVSLVDLPVRTSGIL